MGIGLLECGQVGGVIEVLSDLGAELGPGKGASGVEIGYQFVEAGSEHRLGVLV